jgi:hypothetical protein
MKYELFPPIFDLPTFDVGFVSKDALVPASGMGSDYSVESKTHFQWIGHPVC